MLLFEPGMTEMQQILPMSEGKFILLSVSVPGAQFPLSKHHSRSPTGTKD